MTVLPCDCLPMREMRAALADRNGLARECADLRDQVTALTEKVRLLEPLATAGRTYIAVRDGLLSGETDDEDMEFARRELQAAAESWWDR